MVLFVLPLFFMIRGFSFSFLKNIHYPFFLFFILFALLLGLSLYENDALEYCNMANLFFRDKSFSIYPFVDADPLTGFYTPIRHPLGYPSLLVFELLIGFKIDIAAKFINAYYMSLFVMLVSQYVGRTGILYVFSAPLFVYVFSTSQIDIFRIFLFTLSVVVLSDFFEHKKNILLPSFTLGLALFSHSLSLLCLPFLVFGFFFLQKKDLWKVFFIGISSFLMGGEIYIKNLIELGKLVSDTNPIWELDGIDEKSDLAFRRHIDSTINWLFFGFLQGFTKIHFFGIHFYLGFYSIVKNGFKGSLSKEGVLYKMSCFGVLMFFSIVLFAGDLGAKNPRYFLTIVPLLFFISRRIDVHVLKKCYIGFAIISLYGLKNLVGWSTHALGDSLYQHPSASFFEKVRSLGLEGNVLAFEQELFLFYGKGKMVNHLDPRLIEFYKTQSLEDAFHVLKKNNIKYVYLSPYMPATFYNSVIVDLVGNPLYSKLLIDENGYRLFSLEKRNNVYPKEALRSLKVEVYDGNFISTKLYHKNKMYKITDFQNPQNSDIILKLDLVGDGFVEIFLGGAQYARTNVLKSRLFQIQLSLKQDYSDLEIVTFKNTILTSCAIDYINNDH